MNKITEKQAVMRMTMLFAVLYMISYITRINYGAVISEMVSAEGIQKSAASLALTINAITYGSGQLISGFLGDRTEPKKLIFSGLAVTSAMNILIPLCQSPYQMMLVWGINGVAQAFMWPPLVRIMSSVFNDVDYQNACMRVSIGGSVGNILVYAISPICIYFFGWRGIFFVSAACAVIMAAVWAKFCPSVGNSGKAATAASENSEKKAKMSGMFFAFIAIIMFTIALQGALRDGVTTWTPSYISETFRLDSKIAILTGVVMPIFSIIIIRVVSSIYRRINNELLLAGLFFVVGAAAAFTLAFANKSAGLSVFLAALLIGCMHGVNWVQTCMVPIHFKKYGKVSFISGLLNSSTYIGSSVSAYGIAAFSEHFGWHNTVLLWGAIALLGFLICVGLHNKWQKFTA